MCAVVPSPSTIVNLAKRLGDVSLFLFEFDVGKALMNESGNFSKASRWISLSFPVTLTLVVFALVRLAAAQQSASGIIRQDDVETATRLEEYLADHPDADDQAEAIEKLISLYCRLGQPDARNRVLEMKYKMAIDNPAFKELKEPLAIRDFFNSLSLLVQLNVLDRRKDQAAQYIEQARRDVAGHIRSEDLNGLIDQLAVALRRPVVGDKMSLTVESLAAEPIDLAKFNDKVIVIHYWSLTCAPCLREFKHLARIYEERHDKGLEMIGISLDERKADVQSHVERQNLRWPQVCDGKGYQSEAASRFGITALPSVFVIGRDGRVAADEVNAEKLEAAIDRELAK